jgi:hypothetical protein
LRFGIASVSPLVTRHSPLSLSKLPFKCFPQFCSTRANL